MSEQATATSFGPKDFVRTGPDTIMGRYLRLFWHPVYLARELKAGRAVPLKIMSEDFTLYRGENGVAQILAPRCAHRCTQLSTGWPRPISGAPIRRWILRRSFRRKSAA